MDGAEMDHVMSGVTPTVADKMAFASFSARPPARTGRATVWTRPESICSPRARTVPTG